jgi:hypothetical protein
VLYADGAAAFVVELADDPAHAIREIHDPDDGDDRARR